MNEKHAELTARNFQSAQDEALIASAPERYAAPESAYRLAFTDNDFLLREELRPVRMQLELLKPEMVQQEQGIESTIVIFGSARIPSPEGAAQALADAQAGKITAIAVVTVTDRGGVSSCFAGEDQVFTLLGGLEWAKQRMGKEAIGV